MAHSDGSTISATHNPEAATQAAQALLSDPGLPPVPPAAADCHVELPGGYVNLSTGTVSKEAEVRELNGEDEEAISRVLDNLPRYLDTILVRGVVSVGNDVATKELLDGLLAGDRDALLVGIRRATFGDGVSYRATCSACGKAQESTVSLSEDLSVDTLDDVSERKFSIDLPSGTTVEVTLPDGAVSKALAGSSDKTEGALNTILLGKTVKSINGFPVFADDQVRKLSIRDRRAILKELAERNPGPRFGEVSRPCDECGEKIPLPLNMVDLFLV